MSLTPKQQQFVAEYLVDLNATQAAIRCGYAEPTANREGSRLLSNVDIAAEIAKRTSAHAKKLDITAEKVLAAIAEIAFGDVRKMFTADGSLIRPHGCRHDQCRRGHGRARCQDQAHRSIARSRHAGSSSLAVQRHAQGDGH